MNSLAVLTREQRRALIPALAIAMCAALTIDAFAAMSGVLASRWDTTLSQTGLFTVSGTLGWAAGQLFAGRAFAAAARLASGLALFAAAGLTAASFAMDNFIVALALRVFAGFGAGLAFAGSRLVLRSVAEGAALARLMSVNNTVFLAVLAGAPAIGALLASMLGPSAVVALHGCATLAALTTLSRIAPRLSLDQAPKSSLSVGGSFSLPTSLVAFSCATFTVAHGMAFAAPAVVAGGGTDTFAGVVLIAMAIAAVASQMTNARLVRDHDLAVVTRNILLVAVLVLTAAAAFLGQGAALPGVIIALILGRTLTSMAGTNLEAVALSHPASSLDAIALRRGGAILVAGATSGAIGLAFPDSPATWIALAPLLAAAFLALVVTARRPSKATSRPQRM